MTRSNDSQKNRNDPVAREFTDFDLWSKACTDRGFKGPNRIQGLNKWDFISPQGSAAVWDNGRGTILTDATGVTQSPVAEPDPVPEPVIEESPFNSRNP